MHEVLHFTDDTKAGKQLQELLNKYATEQQTDAMVDTVANALEATKNKEGFDFDGELSARQLEQLLFNENIINRLTEDNSSLSKRILNKATRLLNALKGEKLAETKELRTLLNKTVKLYNKAIAQVGKGKRIISKGVDKEDNQARHSFRSSKSGMANDKLLPYNNELQNIIERKGDYIVDSFEKLEHIVNIAFDNPNQKATAYFGIIEAEQLEKTKNSIPNLPKDLDGTLFKEGREYSIAVTLDSIRHIVDEKSLTRKDVVDYLDRLADTVIDFDSVSFSYYQRGKEKTSGLLFRKRFLDGTLISYNLISHNKRSLTLQSLYMNSVDYKKKKSAETLLLHNDNATTRTSETQVSQTSINSISEENENVNSFDENSSENVSKDDIRRSRRILNKDELTRSIDDAIEMLIVAGNINAEEFDVSAKKKSLAEKHLSNINNLAAKGRLREDSKAVRSLIEDIFNGAVMTEHYGDEMTESVMTLDVLRKHIHSIDLTTDSIKPEIQKEYGKSNNIFRLWSKKGGVAWDTAVQEIVEELPHLQKDMPVDIYL